jgi:purine-binding chemotaxis protein CheW
VTGGRARSATLAKDLIRIEVGAVMYAIEVARVREIVNPLPLIELPRERAFLLGVSDYREQVVPVVDLRRLFGLRTQETSRKTKWVIVEAGEELVAIVADAVLDVFSSAENRRRSVPLLDERQRERGITSAYTHGDQLVFLLDVDRIAEPAMQIRSSELASLPSEVP